MNETITVVADETTLQPALLEAVLITDADGNIVEAPAITFVQEGEGKVATEVAAV